MYSTENGREDTKFIGSQKGAWGSVVVKALRY
jgi:hypothetical protein